MKLLDLFDQDPEQHSGCSEKLMKCLFSFVITYFLLFILSFIVDNEESQEWMPVALLFVFPLASLINSIYMFLLYALNYDNGRISGFIFILIESVFLIVFYSGISYLISVLPDSVIFRYDNGSQWRREVFSENYIFLFTYLLLTIFLIVLKKLFSQKTEKNNFGKEQTLS
ncbi:hypothetical protein SDC9_51024 [bioreactor metagenome]|uniref:Uncharacterized protein n=1 Tax=bioreactor metagenome TaxID=1076179 RepID=A0A644WLI7_9ZZZZ